jgi:TonB family protein
MIASAMLYTVQVSVPLGAAAWFVARFLRSHGRAERGVWIVALAATLLFPALTLSRPRPVPAAASPPVLVDVSTPTHVATLAPIAPSGAQSLDIDGLLVVVWVVLSLSLALRWALSAIRLGSLERSWIPETLDGVPVALTPELGPAVTGILRPKIIVPAWVPALPAHQRALVLQHEQEHIGARDPWLNTFARISRIFTPWNPVTWLLGIGLERAVELDCDRRVLRRHPNIESYGETLLIVSTRGSNKLLAAAAFAETHVPLRKRILAMTTPPRAMSLIGALGAVAVGTVILGSTVAVPVPALRTESPPTDVVPPHATSIVASPTRFAEGIPPEENSLASAASEAPPSVDAATEQAQQALAEPRVIADPGRWMIIYRSMNDLNAGNAPLARVPWSSRDSAFAAIQATLGDSALFARLMDDVRDGTLGDSARMLLPVGVRSVALPSDPPQSVTVPPRILNPDEIVEVIGRAYPRTLLAQERGGTVGVHFLVGVTGEVERIKIAQISAYPALDEAAVQVASVYRFSPARRGDEPVAVWVAHAISFYPPQ